VFVETDPAAVKAIERNLEKLALGGARIARSDVPRYLAGETARYDVVFVDPPYEMVESLRMPLAEHLPRVLADGGSVVFETAAGVEPDLPLPVRSTRRHGSTQLTVFDAP
jgi:16S rRNA G966 N2-methylase RsmD